MDIDISVLRLMEREKDLPFEVLASAIEDALLTAYEKSDGAVHGARVDLNRKTGHVTVMAPEYDAEGQQIGEYDNTPQGFGRVAASTARQVIMQRLRDAEDEQKCEVTHSRVRCRRAARAASGNCALSRDGCRA